MNDLDRVAPRARLAMGALALLACALGCASSGGSKTQTASGTTAAQGGTVSSTAPTQEPDRISVQHILIGFSGSVPGKTIKRTQEEAKVLAYQILERAKAGEAYDTLVREYTDDSWPGTYAMTNRGVAPASAGEYSRDGMVPAFGNVGFKLGLNEFGVADYDPTTSPYGWHIIKRVR